MASLQGMASLREDALAPAHEPCKDGAEILVPAANGEDEQPREGGIPNNVKKNEPLHSALDALSKELSSISDDSPSFKGTLRRKKRVSGLRDAAS